MGEYAAGKRDGSATYLPGDLVTHNIPLIIGTKVKAQIHL